MKRQVFELRQDGVGSGWGQKDMDNHSLSDDEEPEAEEEVVTPGWDPFASSRLFPATTRRSSLKGRRRARCPARPPVSCVEAGRSARGTAARQLP